MGIVNDSIVLYNVTKLRQNYIFDPNPYIIKKRALEDFTLSLLTLTKIMKAQEDIINPIENDTEKFDLTG